MTKKHQKLALDLCLTPHDSAMNFFSFFPWTKEMVNYSLMLPVKQTEYSDFSLHKMWHQRNIKLTEENNSYKNSTSSRLRQHVDFLVLWFGAAAFSTNHLEYAVIARLKRMWLMMIYFNLKGLCLVQLKAQILN